MLVAAGLTAVSSTGVTVTGRGIVSLCHGGQRESLVPPYTRRSVSLFLSLSLALSLSLSLCLSLSRSLRA